MQDLIETVLAAQNGDESAFSDLVIRFQDMAVGYAFGILGDFHRDQARDAFLETYRRLGQLKEPVAFPAWFRRVV